MLIVIDNYDSFTYNLVQYLGELYRGEIRVFRNDKVTPGEIAAFKPTHVVVSPGPCTPREACISVEAVKTLGPAIPLLGVCLGHQSIGTAFGGHVVRAPYLMHGKVSAIHHKGTGIYKGLPNPFTATRYHSLIIERSRCPECLEITSETEDGIIMGVKHRDYPVFGVQFHPEAILTEGGKTLLKNFLGYRKKQST
jgi:anthranilate synthase component 2